MIFSLAATMATERLNKKTRGASSPVKLPNPERAVVDIDKLRNYCLNREHRRAVTKHVSSRRRLGRLLLTRAAQAPLEQGPSRS